MEEYNFKKIEKKWRRIWEKKKIYKVDLKKARRPYYNLMMFPYPSAEGLHVGNVYAFVGSDIHGRFKRLQGYDVFEPIGFDAFGIHSENYALSQGIHPKVLIPKNIEHFRNQLKSLGAIYDWSCEIDTTSPDYYKWTQWLFLQFFKAGLAYRKKAFVNWCPSCKTVLADEQVISGKCERCETQIIQKEMEQWFLRITKYGQRLLKNLEWLDWSERTKIAQRNWIGKSEGAIIKFKIANSKLQIEVFTTRPETIFGATYLVIAPGHEIISRLKTRISNFKEVQKYIEKSKKGTEFERAELIKVKTGVELKKVRAINPANNQEIPIFVADYILATYGTGAIMAVPGHDQRDFDFAKKHQLPIIEVISPNGKSHRLSQAYEGKGILINSGKFNGLTSWEAKEKIIKFVKGKKATSYHLRDWLISRQRYWGPPIPLIFCKSCAQRIKTQKIKKKEFSRGELENPGWIAVPEKDLPVLLPEVEDFRPTGTGISPLAQCKDWVKVACPKCGKLAKRETDVSDTFLDSSWYFLRYPSTHFKNIAFDKKLTQKWLPVDMYIGGQEHACLHLLYTRFVTMALKDLNFLDFEEPFKKFRAHGLIIKNGAKMSKSRGNVVVPDQYLEKYGTDCLRMFLMFIGPFSQGGEWEDAGIQGIWRFLNKVWKLKSKLNPKLKAQNHSLKKLLHQTIKKATEDLESLHYNTAISALMILVNKMAKQNQLSPVSYQTLLKLLAPFAPYLTEELWHQLGHCRSVHQENWPEYDPKLIEEKTFSLIIQVNGKVRDVIDAKVGISENEAKELALKSEKIKKWIEGREITKVFYIKNRLLNLLTDRPSPV